MSSKPFGPISESEIDIMVSGLGKLLLMTTAKDGSVTLGEGEVQYTTSHETVSKTLTLLSKALPGQFDVFGHVFERKALRCCTGYLKLAILRLTTRTLPEYDKRMSKATDPLTKTKLMSYIVEAKARLEIMSGLLNRMERCL